MQACPVCGSEDSIIHEGGCYTCVICGYSKCEVSFDKNFQENSEKGLSYGFKFSEGREEKTDSI